MNDAEAIRFAQRVLELAWADLPPRHRELLEAIGAEGWDATARSLGTYADELLRSAGYPGLDLPSRIGRDRAWGKATLSRRDLHSHRRRSDANHVDILERVEIGVLGEDRGPVSHRGCGDPGVVSAKASSLSQLG